jgi:hypothetical protein
MHLDKGCGYPREAVTDTISGRVPVYVEWCKWIQ